MILYNERSNHTNLWDLGALYALHLGITSWNAKYSWHQRLHWAWDPPSSVDEIYNNHTSKQSLPKVLSKSAISLLKKKLPNEGQEPFKRRSKKQDTLQIEPIFWKKKKKISRFSCMTFQNFVGVLGVCVCWFFVAKSSLPVKFSNDFKCWTHLF